MESVKDGDKVKINYTGKLKDGTVFDTSISSGPLEFTVGEGKLMVPLETGVVGMQVGDRKTLTIPPENAFGERSDKMIFEFSRSELPSDAKFAVGDQLKMKTRNGREVDVVLKKVTDETVTIDANHPLAGETLVFEIEMLEIKAA